MSERIKRTKLSSMDPYFSFNVAEDRTKNENKRDLLKDIADDVISGVDYRFRIEHSRSPDFCSDGMILTSRIIYGTYNDTPKQTYLPWPQDVIFNPPATIVLWDDGTKTVVKCMDWDEYDPEVGLAMCFCKKVMGDGYKRWFKDAMKKGDWDESKRTVVPGKVNHEGEGAGTP